MKSIILNSAVLVHALEFCKKAFEKRCAVPVMDHYLLEVSGETMKITAGDLHLYASAYIRIEAARDTQFKALLEPGALAYLKSVGERPVRMDYTEESYSVVITELETELKDQRTITKDIARAKFSGDNTENYPRIPEAQTDLMIFPLSRLAELKDLLTYATADELRPAMTGINFGHLGNDYKLTATNAHIIKIVTIPELRRDGDFPEDPDTATDFILPAKAAKLLADMGKLSTADPIIYAGFEDQTDYNGNVTRTFIKNIRFDFSDISTRYEIVTKVIDERYPAFWKVIPEPTQTKTTYTGEIKPFLKTLDKTEMFANKISKMVVLKLNGVQTLSAEDLDFSREYSANITGAYDGEQIEIGFKADFLRQCISSFKSKEFALEMIAPNKPAIIRQDNALTLLMPVKIERY
jgi:DNA polymerase-3 subunit beta